LAFIQAAEETASRDELVIDPRLLGFECADGLVQQ